MTRLTCPVCGRQHDELPVFAFPAPTTYQAARAEGRASEYELGPDLCRRGDDEFYIRGRLRVPVTDSDQPFELGVWAKVSAENFWRYRTKFMEHDASVLGVFFGWFANAVPGYGETVNLKVAISPQNDRQRPFMAVIEAPEAPLAIAQAQGVTLDEAMRWLHENGGF